jgi:mitochondrial import inner membrane translocase subunit TIM44
MRSEDVLSRTAATYARHFSTTSRNLKSKKHKEASSKAEAAEEQTKSDGESSKEKSESEQNAKDEEAEGEAEGQKKEKKDKPPPPPHGSKTPWQVFTETLQTEFKASKEWNDSTKQLASGYQEFTQNENIQKARKAYSSATDAASSTTSAAFKSTGRVIGQGAAWAWDTSVMKGVRKGASAAGSGIEKATRPVRETEAYKNVRDVIDDGSSSRYGGWVEKEERRKQRELREAKEMASGKRRSGPMTEDPE